MSRRLSIPDCTVATLYLAPVAVMTVWAWSHHSPRVACAVVLAAALVASVFAAAARTWRLFFVVQFPLIVLAAVFVAYTVSFHMPPGNTLAQILVGASAEEIRGFLSLSAWRWGATLLAVGSAVYLGMALKVSRREIFGAGCSRFTRPTLALLLAGTGYVAADPQQMIDGLALDPAVGSLIFLGGNVPRVHAQMQGSQVRKIPYAGTRRSGEEVHILVVGESARRDSWSAYGYSRATTPMLESLKGEIVLLQDAVADANLTEWSVPIIMTGLPPEGFSIANVHGNLLDLAREAGFRTAWLVNQDPSISVSFGIDADYLEYPPDFKSNINGRHTLDGSLLPAYAREIARSGQARFIGIHMMGAHWEYYRRYPESFGRFGPAGGAASLSMVSMMLDDEKSQSAVVDAYDNATLYTDWFLGRLIEEARALKVPATLTFFPDHGEDLQLLDHEAGHGQPNYTRHAFEIPAFVWMNDAYRRAHPQIAAGIAANASKEIRSHNVFFTEADLMGVKWPGYAATKSFASEEFVPDVGMKHVAGGVLVTRSL